MPFDSESAHSDAAGFAWPCERCRVAIGSMVIPLRDENRRLREQLVAARSETAKWLQAFNSLEKPVTNHIERCIDADDLDRAHGAVMRRFGPNG